MIASGRLAVTTTAGEQVVWLRKQNSLLANFRFKTTIKSIGFAALVGLVMMSPEARASSVLYTSISNFDATAVEPPRPGATDPFSYTYSGHYGIYEQYQTIKLSSPITITGVNLFTVIPSLADAGQYANFPDYSGLGGFRVDVMDRTFGFLPGSGDKPLSASTASVDIATPGVQPPHTLDWYNTNHVYPGPNQVAEVTATLASPLHLSPISDYGLSVGYYYIGFYAFNLYLPLFQGAVEDNFGMRRLSVYNPPLGGIFQPQEPGVLGFQLLGTIDGSPDPSVSATPLPATLPLFATGLGGLGLLGWRRKKKAAALAV